MTGTNQAEEETNGFKAEANRELSTIEIPVLVIEPEPAKDTSPSPARRIGDPPTSLGSDEEAVAWTDACIRGLWGDGEAVKRILQLWKEALTDYNKNAGEAEVSRVKKCVREGAM